MTLILLKKKVKLILRGMIARRENERSVARINKVPKQSACQISPRY